MTQIDAIAYWPPTNKAYFFRAGHYVRYRMAGPEGAEARNDLEDGYWDQLAFTSDIDAAATAAPLDVVYFFKGAEVVEFGIKKEVAKPVVPVAKVFPGLPEGFDRDLDTVVFWPANGKMYFFKGSHYVRYDPVGKRAEAEPSEIADNWPGLTFTDIHAALVGNRGKAYFFKGDEYITYPVVTGDDPALHAPRPWRDRWPGLEAMLGGGGASDGGMPDELAFHTLAYFDPTSPGEYRGSVYFDSASYAIRAEDKPELDKLLAHEADLKAVEDELKWTLKGYADPRNVAGGNDRLSGARAESVQRYWGERLPPHPEVTDLPGEDAKAMEVDGIQFTIVAGGIDPLAKRVPGAAAEELGFHRRVDVWGPPVPEASRRRIPPPADKRGKMWEAKVHMGTGNPSIKPGPGAEAFIVYIRGRDGGDSGKFLYQGPNLSVGMGLSRTKWVLNGTDKEIRVRDFEGPAWHVAGKVPQPGTSVALEGVFCLGPAISAGESLTVGFVWTEAGLAEVPQTIYDVFAALGGGASVGVGALTFLGIEEAPE